MVGSNVLPPVPEQKQQPKEWGVTKPLSLAGPNNSDIQKNRELEKFLIESGLYESAEETARREEVLCKLKKVVKGWVKYFVYWAIICYSRGRLFYVLHNILAGMDQADQILKLVPNVRELPNGTEMSKVMG